MAYSAIISESDAMEPNSSRFNTCTLIRIHGDQPLKFKEKYIINENQQIYKHNVLETSTVTGLCPVGMDRSKMN